MGQETSWEELLKEVPSGQPVKSTKILTFSTLNLRQTKECLQLKILVVLTNNNF